MGDAVFPGFLPGLAAGLDSWVGAPSPLTSAEALGWPDASSLATPLDAAPGRPEPAEAGAQVAFALGLALGRGSSPSAHTGNGLGFLPQMTFGAGR